MDDPNPRILIVDDLSDNLVALEALLRRDDAQLIHARSGREALEALLAYDDVALALIDVQMPEMDGMELAELMRGAERTRAIPIIFVTAGMHDPSRVFRGYESGAVDFLYKPIDPRILASKVDVFLQLHRQKQTLARQLQELKSASATLVRATKAAEAANEAKSRFLANVSHELRTPMNAILGMTELALEEELDPAVRDYLETGRDSAMSLLELLNELLDFSSMEAGKFRLDRSPFDLRLSLDRILKPQQVKASHQGLALHWHVADSVPERLVGDALRLRQVVTNLVANAIKFTARGEVAVSVTCEPTREDSVVLQFTVRDTGMGIAASDQLRIFSPFTQVDDARTRAMPGTGLGLSICSHLVQLMDGTMQVESELDKGSTFAFSARFSIPSTESKSATSPVPAPVDGAHVRPRRVLVADDSVTNQKLVFHLLGKRGHEVVVVNNGREAVERASRERFDLVLMDLMMPVMDGFQATAAIRELPDADRARVRIVALTAHAMKGDQERCLAAGMDGYLSKPFDASRLMALVGHSGLESSPRHRCPVDTARVLDRLGGDRALLHDVLSSLRESLPKALESIQRALAARDGKGLEMGAHKLRGMLLTIDASQAADLCRSLEAAARDGRFESGPADVSRLEQQLSELTSWIVRQQDANVQSVNVEAIGASAANR